METSRIRRTPRPQQEPVVTVHVTYVPRGEDPAFDARWDALWAWLLAPLTAEEEARRAAREGQQPQKQHKTA